MRIKRRIREWKICFLTRRNLLKFVDKMEDTHGDCKMTISSADTGDEIVWIPKNQKITRKQIIDVAKSLWH